MELLLTAIMRQRMPGDPTSTSKFVRKIRNLKNMLSVNTLGYAVKEAPVGGGDERRETIRKVAQEVNKARNLTRRDFYKVAFGGAIGSLVFGGSWAAKELLIPDVEIPAHPDFEVKALPNRNISVQINIPDGFDVTLNEDLIFLMGEPGNNYPTEIKIQKGNNVIHIPSDMAPQGGVIRCELKRRLKDNKNIDHQTRKDTEKTVVVQGI